MPASHVTPRAFATIAAVLRRRCSCHNIRVFAGAIGLAVFAAVHADPGSAVAGDAVELKSIAVEAAHSGANLLGNPGFEEVDDQGIPTGWQWSRGRTDATCSVDRESSHDGRGSLRLTNGTRLSPHVYGMLWHIKPVKLVQGKTYTMSAWVKSTAPGIVQLIGGSDWQFRVQVGPTGGRWRRISKTFSPEARDCDFVLRINTESPTRGVWIDDVKLEEGAVATVDLPRGENAKPLLDMQDTESVVQGDGPFSLTFFLAGSRPGKGVLEAALGSGATVRQPIDLAAGAWRVAVCGEANSADDAPRTVALRLDDGGKEVARVDANVRFYSASNAVKRLAALKAALPSLAKDLDAVKSRGQDVSYPRVAYTVLENFIGYAEEDARRDEVKRSLEQVGDMEKLAVRLADALKEALAGPRPFPAVPRWTGSKRPTVQGSSFVAPVRMADGTIVDRPVFFTGFGHFGQVVADMEKWPHYGTNMIQIEFGPSRVLPAEGKVSDAPMREMLQTLDRTQKAGVAVCLLISPHYFPQWALEKWPHLCKQRDGFLKYCLHAPEGQELLRRYVAAALAPLKDHPALQSICISNEPVNLEEPCDSARQAWRAWLEKRHGNVATLNARCGTKFASIADVPLPSPFGPRPENALWIDFIQFNQEFFAGWHKMLADAVHQAAPNVPVHAKAMTWTMINDIDVKYGVDAYLFSRFSNINGNDSVNFFDFDDGEFAQGWQLNAMSYDLQRSVLDAPVLNSENHLITDRDTRYVPASHIRAALWQAAVHGQSATAIWVWERCFDPKSDLAASIMHRPACTEAVGVVNCDLNRAAIEMTALQQAKPQALLLQSYSAAVWDGARYVDCASKLYTALSFTGLKLGFAAERQLEDGRVPEAAILFVPNIAHLSDAAMTTLRKFKGRIVFVGGDDVLTRNEYGQPRSVAIKAERIALDRQTARELWSEIHTRLPGWNVHPAVELRGADQKPAWGVEWRTADTSAGLVVNLCNYRKTPETVTLVPKGPSVVARDVLSGQKIAGPLTLAPLEVRLLRLEAAKP